MIRRYLTELLAAAKLRNAITRAEAAGVTAADLQAVIDSLIHGEALTYTEMESERDRLAGELYNEGVARSDLQATLNHVRALPARFKSVAAVHSDRLTPEAKQVWSDAAGVLAGVLDAYPVRTDRTEHQFEETTGFATPHEIDTSPPDNLEGT